ncbi:MAG: hypothetical protein ACLQFR_22345 [Streptosporangiaceae bacterium]
MTPPRIAQNGLFRTRWPNGANTDSPRQIGGYLNPSLCMPHLTRTSAAWTYS